MAGLGYLHRLGLAHGNLKPSNLLVREGRRDGGKGKGVWDAGAGGERRSMWDDGGQRGLRV